MEWWSLLGTFVDFILECALSISAAFLSALSESTKIPIFFSVLLAFSLKDNGF